MGRRREPGQREYNPLDDARGRLPIESELVRDVLADEGPFGQLDIAGIVFDEQDGFGIHAAASN